MQANQLLQMAFLHVHSLLRRIEPKSSQNHMYKKFKPVHSHLENTVDINAFLVKAFTQ